MTKRLHLVVGAILTMAGTSALAGAACATASSQASASSANATHAGSASGLQSRLFTNDRNYTRGKSAYLARSEGGAKIKYCVMVDGEAKKLSRSRLKSFDGGSVDSFMYGLVDCANPENLALAQVDRERIPYVVYYLSQRYQVGLVRLSPEERLAKRAKPALSGEVVASAR